VDTKQILISIRTQLKQEGLKALKSGLNAVVSEMKAATSRAGNLGMSFLGLGKGILGALNPLRLFNTIFGRVTLAMGIWQAWRTVAKGFRAIAEAVVGTNAAIQTARASFTTLTGSSEKASRLISIVRQTAMETGVAFSDLVFESRRLTTQLGQNEQGFQRVTRAAVALSALDPVQGVSGAMFALSGFLEGTAQGARSLAQRFELPFHVLKQALQDAQNPVDALDLAFQRLGIDVDDLIQRGRYTLPVIVSNLREMLRTFLQISGQPLITRITQDLARLRDWVEANRDAILGLARAIGAMLERLYLYARLLLERIFPALGAVFSIDLPEFKDRATQVGQAIGEGAAEAASEAAQQAAAEAAVSALEATEQAQKEAIQRLQSWVNEAAKVVQAQRDKMRVFDLMTSDIPERFTRGRKRQMELELLAAEQEERRRKEALNLAQQQLQATQEQIAAQRELAQAMKDTADTIDEMGGADLGFGEVDLGESENAIEQWAQVWGEQLTKVEMRIRNTITAVSQLFAGLFGKDPLVEPGFPGQVMPFEEFYEFGQNVRQTILDIKSAFEKLWPILKKIVDYLTMTPEELAQELDLSNKIQQALAVPGEKIGKDVLGLSDEQFEGIGQWLAETATRLGLTFGQDMSTSTQDALTDAEGDMEEAAKTGVENPITTIFKAIKEAVVGNSIVPEMLRDVVRNFTELPGRLVPPLQSLMNLLTSVMEAIRTQWAMDWAAMVQTASTSIQQIEALQSQMAATQAQLNAATAQATASPPSVQLSGSSGGGGNLNVSMNLDADETHRIWMDGIYAGILSLPTS